MDLLDEATAAVPEELSREHWWDIVFHCFDLLNVLHLYLNTCELLRSISAYQLNDSMPPYQYAMQLASKLALELGGLIDRYIIKMTESTTAAMSTTSPYDRIIYALLGRPCGSGVEGSHVLLLYRPALWRQMDMMLVVYRLATVPVGALPAYPRPSMIDIGATLLAAVEALGITASIL